MIETLVVLFELTLKKTDKFVLSKSHASFPLCITLRKKGYNTKMTTHLELDKKMLFIVRQEVLDMAFLLRLGWLLQEISKKKWKNFVMISDSECQEGTT